MSLTEYQRQLARAVADPSYRRTIAHTPSVLAALPLDDRERKRLTAFARDPGMRVNTALYRANRLTPIYSALPHTCAALGERLHDVLRDLWSAHELEDLQFSSEAARFSAFLQRSGYARERPGLGALVAVEIALYELLVAPRSFLRRAHLRSRKRGAGHPLVRALAIDVDPQALLEVIQGKRALGDVPTGSGGILIDHRIDPGFMSPLSLAELAQHARL